MRKYLTILILFLGLTLILSAYKTDNFCESINEIINKSLISQNSTVSVSIREVQTEKTVFERDANLFLHPASTLKAFTTPVILDILGKNYKVSTGIYKDSKGNFYLKLCGDPMLNTDELSELVKGLKAKGYNKINGALFIDSMAIDAISWGVGWMWDDKNNPLMPKFNAYNLNSNLISLPTGTKIPVESPERFFKDNLAKVFKTNGIKFSGRYKSAKVSSNAVLISEISHKLLDEVKIINKQSDNLAAETLFKLAGGKFAGKQGSTENGLKAFNYFYSKLGLDTSEIFIVDASGVSHNNLITANWMTSALTKLYKTTNFVTYKNTLATPLSTGTLKNRLPDLKNRLYAKTGTNAGISAITGYITDNNGKTYAFSIIIQNFKGTSASAKELEDKILLVFK